MIKIKYLKGDATQPLGDKTKVIVHIVNDLGGWGAGFVVALSNRWEQPEAAYRKHKGNLTLGTIELVKVEKDTYVVNMVAQHDIKPNKDGIPPIRYKALSECLKQVNYIATRLGASIHAPKFGSGLSGGDWNKIEAMIEEIFTVPVYVYIF